MKINRPEGKKFVVTGDDFGFAKTIGVCGHVLVFVTRQRPALPAPQPVPVAQMEDGEQIIIRHHVVFAGFTVNRKQDHKNVVAEKPVLDMAVKRNQRGVIPVRVRRALLKIERENRETFCGCVIRVLAAGKAEQLDELPAILHAKPLASQHRIQPVEFL